MALVADEYKLVDLFALLNLCLPCALECLNWQYLENTKKWFWVGQNYILKKSSKHGFGWAKNTYSKNTQKVVAGCPKG